MLPRTSVEHWHERAQATPRTPTMLNVIELNDLAAVEPFRKDWARLHGQTAGATFFHTLEWLEIYWRHFGREQKLRVLVIEKDGAPTGIVPLVVRRERTRAGTVRVLTYPLHDWGSSYGPLSADPRAVLGAACVHVR